MSTKKAFQIRKIEIIALLVFLTITLVLYLKTTLSTHIVFGDEGFHARISQLIAENQDYITWFGTELEKTGFSRPPLFNILQASFLFMFGSSEIIIKVLTPFISILTGLSVFLLIKKLYGKGVGILASIILLTLPSVITYSTLFYTDMLFTFYTTLFILLFILSIKEDNKKYWILSALFAGLAFLTKLTGIIFFIFIPLTVIYLKFFIGNWSKTKIIRYYALFGSVFLILILPFLLRNLYYFQTPLCGANVPFFNSSGCAVSEFTPKYKFPGRSGEGPGSESNLLRFGLINFINFGYGEWSSNTGYLKFINKILDPFANSVAKFTGFTLSSLFLIIGLFGGVIIFVTKGDHFGIILFILFILSFIIIYQTSYRTEDTARHILMWAPVISVISSFYWIEIYKSLNRIYKYLGLFIIILALLIGFQNLTSKLKTIEAIKQFSPSFFEACDWVKGNLPKDSVLLTFWGYRAGFNCQRAVSPAFADIRLSDDPEYINQISKQHGITHLFIQKFSISPQPTRESYSTSFVTLLENNTDYFEKVYENGPSLNDCLDRGACDGNIIYKIV